MSILSSFADFPLEYCLSCLAFMIPLRKKNGWIARAAVIIASEIFINYFLIRFLQSRESSMIPALVFISVMGILMIWACTESSFWDAVFGASCGYATQHLSYLSLSVFQTLVPADERTVALAEVLIPAVTILVCYFIFARKLPIDGLYRVGWKDAVRGLTIVVPLAITLNIFAERFYQSEGNLALYLLCRAYAAICCIFALWIQTSINERVSIETEYRTQQRLWEKQREQYQLSRENIDIINRKCHDLKYQVAALRQEQNEQARNESLDAIEKSVMIYDANVSTGNQVLDTILTERSLSCEEEHISWTCVADGSKLGHINPVDLYILFGNILDNAIESVRKLDDPAQRVISLNVYTRSNMAVIQLENYYSGTIQIENGLPRTTKQDQSNHGFGMRSVKSIIEKYGGSMSMDADGQIFLLSILLPLQN